MDNIILQRKGDFYDMSKTICFSKEENIILLPFVDFLPSIFGGVNEWAAPCKNVPSGMSGQRRPRSACASTQSDHGLPR